MLQPPITFAPLGYFFVIEFIRRKDLHQLHHFSELRQPVSAYQTFWGQERIHFPLIIQVILVHPVPIWKHHSWHRGNTNTCIIIGKYVNILYVVSYFCTAIPMKLFQINQGGQTLLFVPERVTWFDLTLQSRISSHDSLRWTQMQEYRKVLWDVNSAFWLLCHVSLAALKQSISGLEVTNNSSKLCAGNCVIIVLLEKDTESTIFSALQNDVLIWK